jgi:hypothetical protein
MRVRRGRTRIAFAAIPVVLLGIAALAATAGTAQRAAVLRQLERPATVPRANVGPGPGTVRVGTGRFLLTLTLSPNRGAVVDRLSARLTEAGSPVAGARIVIGYSMPEMQMWNAYTSTLPPTVNGTAAATEAVLGMPGLWQLDVHVSPPDAAPFSVTVDDQLRS